jgi:Leucine-rich repeat (LRR) protein
MFMCAVGLALLISTGVRIGLQYKDCSELVGSTVWQATSPKALFPNGFLSSTGCGFEYVSRLKISNDKSVTQASLDLIIAQYHNLQHLDLPGCAVERIPEELVTRLTQLNQLDMSANEIHFVHPRIFDILSPTTLNIANNIFVERVEWSGTCGDTDHVYVRRRPDCDLTSPLFVFVCTGLGVGSLPSTFVEVVKSTIVELRIRHHCMRNLPLRVLREMTYLQVVDLSQGEMQEWEEIGVGTWKLLNLSHNQLESPPAHNSIFFKNMEGQDTVLDLSYNRFATVGRNLITFNSTVRLQGQPASCTLQFDNAPMLHFNPDVMQLIPLSENAALNTLGLTVVPEWVQTATQLLIL